MDAYRELERRRQATRTVNLAAGFDSALHPRAAAGASGGTGGQFVKAGKARDKAGAEAQKNKVAEKNSELTQTGKADPAKMNDKDLQDLAKYLYSFKSADKQVVAARIKVANALAKRGMNVNDFGGLGKKTPTKAGVKKAVAAVKKPAAKKKAPAKKAAPKKATPVATGAAAGAAIGVKK